MTPTVLSIAGLDPSGGAGLTADIKTATIMKAHGMSVITAVTVQHPGEVVRIEPVNPELVQQQIETLLKAMPIHAIKIGMLGNTSVAKAVHQALMSTQVPIVLDPIHQSTSGQILNQIEMNTWTNLIELASIVTPNDDEIGLLIGNINPQDWVNQTNTALLQTGVEDGPDGIKDILWTPQSEQQTWRHPKIQTQHTHGTGCTLSTAIAVGLGQGFATTQAINNAIQLVKQLIQESMDGQLVDHNGPLLHFKAFG